MDGIAESALTLAIVTNGLLAGLFFAFTCAVSPALGRLDDARYVTAFRSINATILNGAFLAVFFSAPTTAIGAAVLVSTGPLAPLGWLTLGAGCSAATFFVTVAANVPLNRALERARTTTPSQLTAAREAFEARWNRWNLARTLTSVAAVACLAAACVR